MESRWYVLIHQIPPRPLYLRAKIRQRLAQVGAILLKNSVYLLPANSETLEDFQWIAEEVISGGGQAWVMGGEFLSGTDEHDLISAFHESRHEDYATLRREIVAASSSFENAAEPISSKELASAVTRIREHLDAILAIDFFDSPEGKEITKMVRELESRMKRTARQQRRAPRRLRGRTWVTRSGIKVDRIASAWLIRRYIDPDARFRFVDAARWKKTEEELAFDIVGGDYSHEGDRCTFETLSEMFEIRDAAVEQIGQIVHDIDLKDSKFGRADAAGIQLVIQGLLAAHPGDEERLERGFALLDDLARSFSIPVPAKARKTQDTSSRKKK